MKTLKLFLAGSISLFFFVLFGANGCNNQKDLQIKIDALEDENKYYEGILNYQCGILLEYKVQEKTPVTVTITYKLNSYFTSESISFNGSNNEEVFHTFLKNCTDCQPTDLRVYVEKVSGPLPTKELKLHDKQVEVKVSDGAAMPVFKTVKFSFLDKEKYICDKPSVAGSSESQKQKLVAPKAVYTVIMD